MKQKISTSITYIITFLGMAPNLYPQFWPCIYSLWYFHIRISLEPQGTFSKPSLQSYPQHILQKFTISIISPRFQPKITFDTSFYPQPIHRLSRHTNHVQFHDTHLLCVFTEHLTARAQSWKPGLLLSHSSGPCPLLTHQWFWSPHPLCLKYLLKSVPAEISLKT